MCVAASLSVPESDDLAVAESANPQGYGFFPGGYGGYGNSFGRGFGRGGGGYGGYGRNFGNFGGGYGRNFGNFGGGYGGYGR